MANLPERFRCTDPRAGSSRFQSKMSKKSFTKFILQNYSFLAVHRPARRSIVALIMLIADRLGFIGRARAGERHVA